MLNNSKMRYMFGFKVPILPMVAMWIVREIIGQNTWLLIPLTLFVAGVGWYYYRKVKSLGISNILKVSQHIGKTVIDKMNSGMQISQEPVFVLNNNGMSGSISYQLSNSVPSNVLWIPYRKKLVVLMQQYDFFLVCKEDLGGSEGLREVEYRVFQQPGIPFLVSAADLGGDYIVARNLNTGEDITWTGTNIPDLNILTI